MATYRERREAKADRLRGWAGKREEGAQATFAAHEVYRGDDAFNTQPGHIPLRSRVIAQDDRTLASLRKAKGMRSRASGIESQLERSIYSDDPDAIPALERRIADLEAQRERVKAYNYTARRGRPDLSMLEAAEKLDLQRSASVGFAGKSGEFPKYVLANLGGNIARNRERLAELRRRAGQSRTRAKPTRATPRPRVAAPLHYHGHGGR